MSSLVDRAAPAWGVRPPGAGRANRDHRASDALARRYKPGVRLKFNLVLLPALTILIGMFAWFDYRHEVEAVMEAHTIHTVSGPSGLATGPVDPSTSPGVVGRRALMMHAALGLVVLVSVALAVNWTVWFLVLRPLDRIRDRVDQMTRGQWRTTTNRASDDEIGQLTADFDRLGLAVDALAGQLLYAERLATLALVSKRLEASILPQVQRIVAAVSRLQRAHGTTGDRLEDITDASIRIVATLKALDRLFEPGSPRCAVSAVPRPLEADDRDGMPIQPLSPSAHPVT